MHAVQKCVLENDELLQEILGAHAQNMNGWGSELWKAAAVCRQWHSTIIGLRPLLEEWGELEWELPPPPNGLIDGGIQDEDGNLLDEPRPCLKSPQFTSGRYAAYRWELDFYPSGDRPCLWQASPAFLFFNMTGLPIGLEDPRLMGAHDVSCSPTCPPRISQFSIELQTKDGRTVFYRTPRIYILKSEATSHRLACDDAPFWNCAAYDYHELLQPDGQLEAVDILDLWRQEKTLRVRVRVRAINGRALCRSQVDLEENDRNGDRALRRPPIHPVAVANPVATYAFPSWTCDMCSKNFFRNDEGYELMHHCTFGCSYDLCQSCARGFERKKTLRPRNKCRRVGT